MHTSLVLVSIYHRYILQGIRNCFLCKLTFTILEKILRSFDLHLSRCRFYYRHPMTKISVHLATYNIAVAEGVEIKICNGEELA